MPVNKWLDEDLQDIGAITPDDGAILVGDGSDWVKESGATARTSLGAAATSHTHAASDINSGTLAHERGGIEADISAVTTGDILAGTSAGTMAIVAASGASDGDVLTLQADGTVAYETPAAGGGGQTLVTRVVAASGGDHTTLGAAVTAASAGDTIWVTPGTYTESAITTSLANLTIIGANPESTVLNFTTNNLTPSGAYFTMKNIKMTFSTGTLECTSTQATFDNVHYSKSGNGQSDISGTETTINNCRFESSQTDDACHIDIDGSLTRITGTYFKFNASETSAGVGTIQLGGTNSSVSGNVFEHNASGAGTQVEFDGSQMNVAGNQFHGDATATIATIGQTLNFTGNMLQNAATGLLVKQQCNVSSNAFMACDNGIVLENNKTNITGNRFQGSFDQSTDKGISISDGYDENTIAGNNFNYMGTGVEVAGSNCDNNHITGNHFNDDITTAVDDSGTTTHIYGNSGSNTLISDKLMRYMKNTSGGALAAGDLVTFKAVAAGDEFTTTTTQGDDLVIGVVAESIGNNAYGHIQTEGKVTTLKVDGTTDIAVGDFIGTFTSAGIGMKAASGDMAIAIALEAYTTDDSNGVIDALLISPRKI
jgi:hypothetical protein